MSQQTSSKKTLLSYTYTFLSPRRILTSTFYTNLIASRFSLLPSTFTGSVIFCNLAYKIHNLLCVPSGFHLVINAESGDLVFCYDLVLPQSQSFLHTYLLMVSKIFGFRKAHFLLDRFLPVGILAGLGFFEWQNLSNVSSGNYKEPFFGGGHLFRIEFTLFE